MAEDLFLLRFGFRKSLTGFANEHGEVVVIVHVSYVEIGFGTFVRWTEVEGAQERTDGFGGFQVPS